MGKKAINLDAVSVPCVPFKLGGYSVSHRNGHASVRIDQESYKRLKVYLTDLAPRRSVEHMIEELSAGGQNRPVVGG